MMKDKDKGKMASSRSWHGTVSWKKEKETSVHRVPKEEKDKAQGCDLSIIAAHQWGKRAQHQSFPVPFCSVYRTKTKQRFKAERNENNYKHLTALYNEQ